MGAYAHVCEAKSRDSNYCKGYGSKLISVLEMIGTGVPVYGYTFGFSEARQHLPMAGKQAQRLCANAVRDSARTVRQPVPRRTMRVPILGYIT